MLFKKILVATDGSEFSRHALALAVEMAKNNQADLEIMHAINPLPYITSEAGSQFFVLTPEQIAEIGQQIMDITSEDIDFGQIAVTKKVVYGYPVAEILEEAEKGFELIVMGTRGHSAFGGAIIGSVTQRILGEAKCPVLIVK